MHDQVRGWGLGGKDRTRAGWCGEVALFDSEASEFSRVPTLSFGWDRRCDFLPHFSRDL